VITTIAAVSARPTSAAQEQVGGAEGESPIMHHWVIG
jgi:hypothetical protein